MSDGTRIRQSEFTTFAWCRRNHHFAYTRGLVPKHEGPRMPASGHRDAGTAAHAGFEALHLGGTKTLAENVVTAKVNELRAIRFEGELPELNEVDSPEWWDTHRYAQAMVESYLDWLEETGFDVGFESLMVEEDWEFEIPGTNGLRAYGTVDLIGRDKVVDGLVVDDWKTVGNFSMVPQPVDFQLRTYAWAVWKMTGEAPKRAGHRMVKRVLRTGRAKRPFVLYAPIHINEDILVKHEQTMAVRALEIAAVREHGDDAEHPAIYPNPGKDCTWRCDFRAACAQVDEGDDWEHVLELNFNVKSDE